MISKEFHEQIVFALQRIERLACEDVPSSYVPVEEVTPADCRAMDQENLVMRLVSQPEDQKARILEIANQSLDYIEAKERQQGGFRTSQTRHYLRWLKAIKGILHLLHSTSMEEVQEHLAFAYDVVKRIVKWSRTNPDCNLFGPFQPYAEEILQIIWGNLDYLL